MAVEQAVDQVQIAGPAASRTHRQLPRDRSLGAGGECRRFLVANMHPVDLAMPAQGIGQAVQAVAGDTPDALYARRGEGLCDEIGDGDHGSVP